MGGKGDTKPAPQNVPKRLRRRANKKPTEQQKPPKGNTTGTYRGGADHYDPEANVVPGGTGKRYQSTRTQAAAQRRDRARKMAGGPAGEPIRSTSPYEIANVPEDMRISKLLRRLAGEPSVRGFLDLCNRLEMALLEPSNAAYVRKSFDILANTLATVLEGKPGARECQNRAAHLFGTMLHVLLASPVDDAAFRTWTGRYLNAAKRIRRSSLVALRQAVVLDGLDPRLEPAVDWLLALLQEILESTDVLDVFVLVTDIMVQLADRYPDAFAAHFSDIVDIVVGWQLESTQPAPVKLHCARVVLALRQHWCTQRDVTFNLLEQLSEDIDTMCGDHPEQDDANRLLGPLLAAFSSVVKCLCDDERGFAFEEDEHSRYYCCSVTLVAVLTRLLDAPNPSGIAVTAICDFLTHQLLVPAPSTLADEDAVRLLRLLIQHAAGYGDVQVGALLHLLLQYLDGDEDRTLSLLPTLFHDSAFYGLRYRVNSTVRNALLLLYHRVLTLKSVPVLQAAYEALLADLDDALGEEARPGPLSRLAQYRIQFVLLVLSPLATVRGSIFITWTLKDRPVLHVLLERLAPADGPHLHHAVLLTAFHHSGANNHFISSSALLQPGTNPWSTVDPSEGESPTADHFALILRFLRTALGSPPPRSRPRRRATLLLLLDWCQAVLMQTSRYHAVLRDCEDFNQLLANVCAVAVDEGSVSETVGVRCADCLDVACQFAGLHASSYQAIAEASCVHLCSVYGALRTRYSVILSRLPLRHSLRQVNEFSGANRRRWEQIGELKHGLYQGGTGSGALLQQQSAPLRMANLGTLFNEIAFSRDGSAYVGAFLHELLTRSFNRPSAYGEMALRDLRCLIPWAQWEAAQLCVNHKLRTPFGKPQSTFLRIESIVKQSARILALSDRFPVRDIRTSIVNQRHARILLGFLEALEKSIYNASEGTAYALPAPEKPARTFFRVNAPTCAEWFTRIRTAVDLVALHCMEPEMVIRYSEAVLRELVASGNTSDLIFEHMLMSLVWALLRNWESDALYGVYVWSKRLTGRKYPWIRMAAEEAAGHRETAADGFRAILADSAASGMDRHIRDFIVDQTVVSLLFTGDYQQLYEFLLAEEGNGTPRATIPLITVTATQIRSILAYEETHDVSVIDLSQWELVDVGTDIANDFSCHKMICSVENSLSGILLLDRIDRRERLIDASTDLIQCYLQECLLTRCHEYLFQLTITNHILYKIAQRIRRGTEEADFGSLNVEKFYGTLTLMRLLAWSEFLQGDGGVQQNIDLRLDLVSIGRKEKNYALCRRELEKYYHKAKLACLRLDDASSRVTLEQVAEAVVRTSREEDTTPWDDNLARAVYQHCKWLYCQPGKRTEAINLAACAAAAIDRGLETRPVPSANLSDRAARFMLTVGDWMASETGNPPPAAEMDSVRRLGDRLPSLTAGHCGRFGPADLLIGRLLQGAVERSPPLSKAWFALGSWLYRWGKCIVEHSAGDGATAPINVDQVAAILAGPDVSLDDCEQIARILNDHERGRNRDVDDEEDELDLDGTATIGSVGLLEALSRAVPALEGKVPPERVQALIDVWRNNHRTVYGYYESAAGAYFRFLQLEATAPSGVDGERARSVTVTLRLLRLIVKHALGLKEVLEEGLATTPSEPWRVITPQLFSRLAHHEPYVRRRVSELLCRVANDAPHLIIFPAVVGAVQDEPAQLAVVDVLRGEGTTVEEKPPATGGYFHALLDILAREIPDTVKQVQTLVHELRRISLLWDELWVVSLHQVYADYTKRVPAFENECRWLLGGRGSHTDQYRALLTEKRRLLLRPLIFQLEQLYDITARPAETNHERHFQDRYHRYIRNMLEKLREPGDIGRPLDGWVRFRTLYVHLQQRSQKRCAMFLRLADVSPGLGRLTHTAIAMPGIDATDRILIRSVDNHIQILPTKTRPKRLTFCGNDGRRFGYLSKGLEDLHLDERIMQFLSIANLMMTKSIDCNGNVTHYRAEHYSVIPLGPRSGLITWVDNTVPIFSLYKRWQQREAQQRKDAAKGNGNSAAGVLRPSDLFYKKLTPLLQSHGMKANVNRREWPLAALKQVLAELQQETPRDLLAKELWCHSATASSWRQVVRRYSLSLAVMSVIGYIIGLGDRHLDNMLVKLATGEIVHIDYNVCFEKGKTLRVPEKVPFRMTPNLEEALGLTGIEGTFRLACEHVLKSLKKGRETLLTLLEAFVYDPLVDWAIGEEIGSGVPMTATDITVSTAAAASNAPGGGISRYISQAKRKLDRDLTRDTLAVRFAECRTDLEQNRDDLLQELLCVRKLLHDLHEVQEELRDSERLRGSLSQQLQVIGEAEYLDTAFGSHPLASLAQRLSARARLQEEHAAQRDELAAEAERLREELERYEKCRQVARDDGFSKLRGQLADGPGELSLGTDTLRLLLAFLPPEDPGYLQYCCARTELSELQRRVTPVAIRALELLAEEVELPASDVSGREHPLNRYRDWYRRLAESEQEPSSALETAQIILREQEEAQRELPDDPAEKPLPGAIRRIIELNRTFTEVEREAVQGGELSTTLLSTLAARLLQECTNHTNITSGCSPTVEHALACLSRVVADYECLERFHKAMGPLANVRANRSDREVQLHEQMEQLLLHVERTLPLSDANPEEVVKAAREMANTLVESWTGEIQPHGRDSPVEEVFHQLFEAITGRENAAQQLAKLGANSERLCPLIEESDFPHSVWYGTYPETVEKRLSELVECLTRAAKLQTMVQMQRIDVEQPECDDSHPVKCFIGRFIRLHLAGRAFRATLALLQGILPEDLPSPDTVHDACREPPAKRLLWLEQLSDAVRFLDSVQPLLQPAFDQLHRHTEALRNRLAWASAAHPPLCSLELPVAFEQDTAVCAQATSDWIRTVEVTCRHARATVRYEKTRHIDGPDLRLDFHRLLDRWQRTLTSHTVRGPSFVSPTEEALVELLDPEGSIDHTWISNVRALIDDMTDQLLTKIARLEQDRRTLQTSLNKASRRLHALIQAHHDVTGDIRSLLRTQLRIDGSVVLRDYLQRYRRFLDLLQDAQKAAQTMARPTDPNPNESALPSVDEAGEKVDELLGLLQDVFEQLFQFDDPPDDDPGEMVVDGDGGDVGSDGSSQTGTSSGAPPDRKARKRKEQQKEQKRNAYAVSVWRRIRTKLEGRDPDAARRCSVPEQVAWMIDEAMDPNNLAVLYEGWTPWV